MESILYNLFLLLYSVGIRLTALWNPKAKRWILGRQNIFNSIEKALENKKGKSIWMHCASLGEFEQGRPVLEAIKKNYPNLKIIITFFSPSGYESAKNYPGADYVFYLPMDNIINSKKFIDLINPSLVLWVKYEYWFYYLSELKKRKIPVLLISGIFRENQPFFKWYGDIWKKMLESFTHFFVQNEDSKNLLASLNFVENVTISGDTRFDRVLEIATHKEGFPIIDLFCGDKKTIVAGSTWEDDEVILAAYGDETDHEFKLIIAPHELDEAHIENLKKMFKNSVCLSSLESQLKPETEINQYDTLIVDSIGKLARLYNYGFINYIGGGFTHDGIHNILEAAVWGKPIVIGDNYEKYFEANDLVQSGAAKSITDVIELKATVNQWVSNQQEYSKSAGAALEYVFLNGGATKKILEYIYKNRLLTS